MDSLHPQLSLPCPDWQPKSVLAWAASVLEQPAAVTIVTAELFSESDFLFLYYFMGMDVLLESTPVSPCVPGTSKGQKRALYPLKVELQF